MRDFGKKKITQVKWLSKGDTMLEIKLFILKSRIDVLEKILNEKLLTS
jgi:hypothetical protein